MKQSIQGVRGCFSNFPIESLSNGIRTGSSDRRLGALDALSIH